MLLRRSLPESLVCVAGMLLGAALLSAPAHAQLGQTAADFRTIQPHPYVHALGDAPVAVQGHPGAIGLNPAAIGERGMGTLGSNLTLRRGPFLSSPWFFAGHWITAPSVAVQRGPWAVAGQLKHFSRGVIEYRDAEGRSQGLVHEFEQSISLTGAYDVTTSLTLGAGLNLIRTRIASRTGPDVQADYTVDLGLQYDRAFDRGFATLRPALGLSLTDFGPNVTYPNLPDTFGAPTTVRGGGALELASTARRFGRPEWRIGVYGALSNLLVSGEFVDLIGGRAYFEADGPFRSLFAGWGSTRGVQTPDGPAQVGPWERLKKHVGVEVAALDVFSVRLGRFHEADTNGGRQYAAFGFGLDLYYASLDVSWAAGDDTPIQELAYGRLTIQVPLGGDQPQNFWPVLFERLN